MNRPNKLIAVPLLFAALAGCRRDDGEQAPGSAEPVNANQATARVPAPLSALSRADLLNAVAEAASAFASGSDDREAMSALDGRTFALTIRFGCSGPAPKDASLGWTSDEQRSKIDIRAAPTLRLDPGTVAAGGGDKVEAVEGFWVPRPWMIAEACPRKQPALASSDGKAPPIAAALADEQLTLAPSSSASPDEESVGIAQYYSTSDSRTRRRAGRAYSATERLDPPGNLPSQGIRLRIEGRLRAWPGGKVVRCSGSPGSRPSCILSATIDRVAFERPEDGTVIAQWAD